MVIFLGFFALFALAYFIPTWLAFSKRHPARWLIFLVNLLLGGTVLGWLIALIWACSEGDSVPAEHAQKLPPSIGVSEPAQANLFQQQVSAPNSTNGVEQISNELLRLKALLDNQVIKKDEFDQLKRRLIAM